MALFSATSQANNQASAQVASTLNSSHVHHALRNASIKFAGVILFVSICATVVMLTGTHGQKSSSILHGTSQSGTKASSAATNSSSASDKSTSVTGGESAMNVQTSTNSNDASVKLNVN